MIVWIYHPGADDLLAPAECGKDSAKAIPGAELMIIDGMGQDMPHGILNPRFRNDMLHIAVAAVAQVDVLVSWNFKHVVRWDKIQKFNGVNIELGYKSLAIYSPSEVTTYEKGDLILRTASEEAAFCRRRGMSL